MTDNVSRIGIFGGTFDPPHLGHLILAEETFNQLDLDRLLWLITPDPPHKTNQFISPLPVRLELLESTLQDTPLFEISLLDAERPGPQYAVDTMKLLRTQYPQSELIYLMGGDSLKTLDAWHEPAAFLDACDELGVMRRPEDEVDQVELEAKFPGIMSKVKWVVAPLLEISSREIRRRIESQQPYRFFLPSEVYAIIEEKMLYR
jgi:nicotinate-nucleotide adenylyltransferase